MSESLKDLIRFSYEIEEKLIESQGLITDEIQKLIELKDAKLPVKIDGYAGFLERMVSLTKHYDEKAMQYANISNSIDKIIEKCEENLKEAMIGLGVKELVGIDVKYKLQNSPPSCVIDNEAFVPSDYKVRKDPVIDKKKILEDLKLGVPVPGCHMEQGQYARKYLNTRGK